MSKFTDNNDLSNEYSAIRNAKLFIRSDTKLPDQVFAPCNNFIFLLMPSDVVFSKKFFSIVQVMLEIENSNVFCCANLNRNIYKTLYASTIEEEYMKLLYEDNEGEEGWIYTIDNHVLTSNVGFWCIYVETENEIAVLAIDVNYKKQISELIDDLGAKYPEELIGKTGSPFPFNELVQDWKTRLILNYGKCRSVNL